MLFPNVKEQGSQPIKCGGVMFEGYCLRGESLKGIVRGGDLQEDIIFQRLANENKIDYLSYLPILKNKLQIEKLLCEKENNHNKFNKFKFIFEEL